MHYTATQVLLRSSTSLAELLTICTPDGKCTDISEGQGIPEGKNATHWAANKGQAPATYYGVEISNEP